MTSNWAPAQGGWAESYLAAVRAQLTEFGEWVEHRPYGLPADWVFMHFLAPPEKAHVGGLQLELSEVRPWLRGLDADFDNPVRQYKQIAAGNARNGTGSQMCVRGALWEVDDVQRNPWGEVRVYLVDAKQAVDPTFDDRLQAMLAGGANA